MDMLKYCYEHLNEVPAHFKPLNNKPLNFKPLNNNRLF